MRELKKLVIYLLLVIGSVVMIAPFAWMIVTSFKLPSEVNSWPPKWTTRSFASSRDVKVVPSTGTVSTVKGLSLREALAFIAKKTTGLNLNVNDDPFYRGTLTIPFKGVRYSKGASQEEFSNFLAQITIPTDFNADISNPEQFFENVFLFYKTGANPFFRRDVFVEGLIGSLESLADTIDMISTFGIDRITDESEKSTFEKFLEDVVKNIELVKAEVNKYKAGAEIVLSDEEIDAIKDVLSRYNFVYSGINEVSENYNNTVRNTVGKYLENIDFYVKVKAYFSEIQNEQAETDIVAVPLSKEERVNLLINRVQDFKDRDLLVEIVKNTSLKNVVEEFAKRIDDEVVRKFNISVQDLASLKTLLGNLINIAAENGLDSQALLNDSYDTFIDALESKVGFNLSYSATKSKLDAYAEEIPNAKEVFRAVALNSLELQSLRAIYEQTVYAWRVVSAPSFVKDVLVKEGKTIEILLEDVHPVYFVDDGIKTVHVKFSPGDVFKNVFQNYVSAWNAAPFGRYYFNTVFIATVTTILEIVISAMAAYAFSWMNFPGKGLLFSIFLATMMVPGEVLLVPNFITITKFGWIDTYYALIVPWVVSVFSIFLMRQHFMSIPSELFDAAKIDGSSHWRFLWQIVVPLSKPVIITSALLKFVGSWNAFLWVLIVTNSPKYRTLTVGLQSFSSEVGTLYNLLMAAATFSILPVVIIFLFAQKYFVRGIARTGLK
ncbi:carbohydrate ABC transporter membrane protein 2, CUT1 family [Fervidobacterium pennivorans DSM 9078]|uniref:Carbohydrate ABC transporter membrane protein 2, CUT1 family n=1 Tax=Fervidobacterium pennivorans (strain DSM 9078 / Ven5) TaxID=771875 RepID=H9UA03_FERPD|nr:carbohydrate ABC transporter permease [Fervidobacterium pennivorans]AFG34346.1 carbohydrate ABC transporter membrane protein 2, CUT1 family [Fervidobacterium pennivorans DSM 9078]QIV77703.1 ABC transporter permease subunit [Fervidobacterium pennivorans subsp. keratinolyticus]